MVVLKPKSTSWNSLWSIIYCLLVVGLQCYISYRAIHTFQETILERWKEYYPSALSAKLGLAILALILAPLFIISSVLKLGNYANDGFKLGRDHALCQTGESFVDKLSSETVKKLWKNLCPFSQTFHIIISFFLLLPDTLVEASDVFYGHQHTSIIWSSNIDFLFPNERRGWSDFNARMNNTVKSNASAFNVGIIYTLGDSVMSPEFVFFVSALVAFTVRYASVFWYTNKALSLTFACQLLFMSVESVFAYTGFSILYKVTINYPTYSHNLSLVLGPGGTLVLYLFGGTTILLSTITVFYYGSHHFHEKFRLVDRKHNPEKYVRHKRNYKGPCNGYVSHSCAVGTLVLLAIFKGPILYDLVSIYRLTSDNLVLTCVVIDVAYMVCWICLWTLLTIKEQWLFRILDYANVGEPIFVIKSDSLLRTPSISIGSIDLKDIQMSRGKRPSSIPSCDITVSESGFDEYEPAPSEEEERFELSLPTVSENPDGCDDDSSSVIMRRSRNRRSGGQRVTFHETVRRSNDNLRCQSPHEGDTRVNVTADVHSGGRKGMISPFRRSLSDIDTRAASPIYNKSSSLPRFHHHSKQREDFTEPLLETTHIVPTASQNLETSASVSESDTKIQSPSSKPPRPHSCSDGVRQTPVVINYKPSNIDTAEQREKLDKQSRYKSPDKVHPKDSRLTLKDLKDANTNNEVKLKLLNDKDYNEIGGEKQPDIVPKDNSGHLYPKPVQTLSSGKTDISRRDSANYSMTSSQDNSSNDSDHGLNHSRALCSQNKAR
ncbi:uncharacterized protein LOC110448656 [Mizuhopecten yessoensis]|uniref:Protein tincar n=1 Tax=Mizuhopecten yessoensis TaxID=6573 RepID=A0A210QSL8_MIZYE|nr:uncharacterized protein LOC110448656 [Mizuhopecten yessoensis]OWF51757.1 Protein tincar [Mizuhopecten yessoensis]